MQESFESKTDERGKSYTFRPFIRTFRFLLNMLPSGALHFLTGLPTYVSRSEEIDQISDVYHSFGSVTRLHLLHKRSHTKSLLSWCFGHSVVGAGGSCPMRLPDYEICRRRDQSRWLESILSMRQDSHLTRAEFPMSASPEALL